MARDGTGLQITQAKLEAGMGAELPDQVPRAHLLGLHCGPRVDELPLALLAQAQNAGRRCSPAAVLLCKRCDAHAAVCTMQRPHSMHTPGQGIPSSSTLQPTWPLRGWWQLAGPRGPPRTSSSIPAAAGADAFPLDAPMSAGFAAVKPSASAKEGSRELQISAHPSADRLQSLQAPGAVSASMQGCGVGEHPKSKAPHKATPAGLRSRDSP